MLLTITIDRQSINNGITEQTKVTLLGSSLSLHIWRHYFLPVLLPYRRFVPLAIHDGKSLETVRVTCGVIFQK